MFSKKFIVRSVIAKSFIAIIISFSGVSLFGQTAPPPAPTPNPIDVLRNMQKTLSGLKTATFEVRSLDGYSFAKDPAKYRAVSKITVRNDPFNFSAKLVADDGSVYEAVTGDKLGMHTSVGGKIGTEVFSKGFHPNNAQGDVNVSWNLFFAPDNLQKIISSNNFLYGGQEEVEGDVCDIIVYVELTPRAQLTRTYYYWISTTTNLPRATQAFTLVKGRSNVIPRRLISNLKINPAVSPETFAYVPVAADSAAIPKTEEADTAKLSNVEADAIGQSLLNKVSPDVDVIDLAYKPAKFSDYKTKGKTTLVTFWATWCAPCLAEMPIFQKLVVKYPDKFQVLAIGSSETMSDSVEFVKKHPDYKFTFLLDPDWQMPDSRIWKVFGVKGLPTNLLIDENNKVIDFWRGGEKEPELIKRIEAAMAKK